jgi:hypothetical protein
MALPDPDLTYLITNSKYDLSFYDIAEINKVYNCPTGEFIDNSTLQWCICSLTITIAV